MTVALYWPRVAVVLAVRVSVAEEVVGFGENAAVTPAGRPETESVTLPVKPYSGLMLTNEVPEVPCPILTTL